MSLLKKYVLEIPNFPKEGIMFRDISPVIKDHFSSLIQELDALIHPDVFKDVQYIAGIESRGFAIAAALAHKRNLGFIPIRKKGKLPGKVAQVKYDLEYGSDALEMHYGSGKIIVVDDVLATGGTLTAAAQLCEQTGFTIASILCVLNLHDLNNFSYKNVPFYSLLTY